MTHKERLLDYLRSIAPDGASNSAIGKALEIRSHATVYQLTQRLMLQGELHGQVQKGVWLFYAPVTAGSVFRPVAELTWELNASVRSRQAGWLAPLLERPAGRQWLVRDKLHCPANAEELEAATVLHFTHPLRDLLAADRQVVRGVSALEEQLIRYYNQLFGLPEDFGAADLWRDAATGSLRDPEGWRGKLLRARVNDRKARRHARDVLRLLATEADLLVITPRHLVLLHCPASSIPSDKAYRRQLRLGELLARRLDRALYFGLLVDEGYQPPFAWKSVPHVKWGEVRGYGE